MPLAYRIVGFTSTCVQSVLITAEVVSWILNHGEVHSIQRYVMKFVLDLQQISYFLLELRFSPSTPTKNDRHNIIEIWYQTLV
jgi:hypothetical protein